MNFNKLCDLIILCEGGAAGHMWHPFDIPSVKTGKDLLNILTKTVESLNKVPASLKIDGVNFAFRCVKRPSGKYEIVRDGGGSSTAQPLDIKGVGLEELKDRWPESHGLHTIAKRVLTQLNKDIDILLPVLKKLGVVSNEGEIPCKLINAEYVNAQTNTINYSNAENPEFISIFNILESDWNDPNKKTTRHSKPVPYNAKDLDKLIEELNNSLSKSIGISVIGLQNTSIEKSVNEKIHKEFTKELNTKLTIKIDNNTTETKTLGEWLEITNKPKTITKAPYLAVLNNKVLSDFIKEKDMKDAIGSIVFYHATRVLGKIILDNVSETKLGKIIQADKTQSHEGIVVNDKSIAPNPFKITGDFLVTNVTQSKFANKEEEK